MIYKHLSQSVWLGCTEPSSDPCRKFQWAQVFGAEFHACFILYSLWEPRVEWSWWDPGLEAVILLRFFLISCWLLLYRISIHLWGCTPWQCAFVRNIDSPQKQPVTTEGDKNKGWLSWATSKYLEINYLWICLSIIDLSIWCLISLRMCHSYISLFCLL
jgi:hypothetical protein